MYFSVTVDGSSHLWRQKFPEGTPSQLTSGPATEERGIAMAPDGRSLVTSVGQVQGSLWIHAAGSDRLLPFDGSVAAPRMSRDGTRVFALVHRIGEPSAFGLTEVDVATGKIDRMLTEFPILDFDISRDEQFVAFTTRGDRSSRQIWIAALDRRSAPRRIASDGDQVRFGRAGELIYRSLTGSVNALVRIADDGSGATRISDQPVIEFGDVSPDGEWAIVAVPSPNSPSGIGTFAVPVHGGSGRQICSGGCPIRWAPDGAAVYLAVSGADGTPRPARLTLRSGEVLPDLAAGSADAPHEAPAPVWDSVAPGPDPSVYVFARGEQRGNLFRVPLR
jgi:hypothetical protein